MKDDLIFIVQECICIDFLINAIMTSNIYKHLNFFSDLKKENLKNIKVICNLYKRTYNDDLLIKDIEEGLKNSSIVNRVLEN